MCIRDRALAKETAAAFEEETGCEVVVDAVAYTGMYDKLSTEIKAKQAAHDVACMDVVWLAAFADAIEPVTGADTSDFLPTLEDSGTIDGNLLGYPMWVNSKILIYRKDLIPEEKVPKLSLIHICIQTPLFPPLLPPAKHLESSFSFLSSLSSYKLL